MDMTLAEQLVWAAVFAQERTKGKGHDQEEIFMARCCMAATAAIIDLRHFTKKTFDNSGLRALLNGHGFEHLRQMTFKADD